MTGLALLGEALRQEYHAWLRQQTAGWPAAISLSAASLDSLLALSADAAALLQAGYELAAVEAWLTAGYMPAGLAAFDEQASAMALVESSPTPGGWPSGIPGPAAPPAGYAGLPAGQGLASQARQAGAAPGQRPPEPVPVPSPAGQAPPAAFQRVRGLQDLAAYIQNVQAAAGDSPASPSPVQSRLPASEPGRDIGRPGQTAGRAPPAQPGVTQPSTRAGDPEQELSWPAGAAPNRPAAGPPLPAVGDDRPAPPLRERFRPLMERRPAVEGEPPWPVASSNDIASPENGLVNQPAESHPPAPSGPSTAAAPGRSVDSYPAPAFNSHPGRASTMAPATPGGDELPDLEVQRARQAGPPQEQLSPAEVEAILEAISEDLEREFKRLYGG